MISGFASNGQLVNAESLFAQLRREGLSPDEFSFHSMLKATKPASDPRAALKYYGLMRAEGIQPTAITYSLLATALSTHGLGADAAKLARMDERRTGNPLDESCYTTLLRACARVSPPHHAAAKREAIWLWSRMQQARMKPLNNPRAVSSLLRCLGNTGDFDRARRLFEAAPRPRSPLVWREMIQVCNLCGEPDFAGKVLEQEVGGIEGLTSRWAVKDGVAEPEGPSAGT
uniref:Pentacotripeptide-repeat region of PRORP domain-containing protein n=1 Tax=Haptolina ericina TaxID=156174 RepID=A0A7S3C4N7_9EUKA|eukprot:CAMPEP_0181214018 /NCGR_PEP_ID=MMETSP1096-20121128/25224_1 /TAXON_ID=156174 ORGANISM="Chrysochromulina ericina, Strain CCMP281" /NCGR_SAMPLE_ID=MMETSP1096 /ASSEMBLY_ACC=CAM_ASM_000453 /LENGTH=229 /DNA_ID=CAMNT_0023305715 /DNA_START=16 /DNA_END=708 /DNA_ORIENTATION=-